MILRKIELKNITVHKDTTVDFTPGINVLAGTNGSGKSTILRMIGFCLFDFLPESKNTYIRNVPDAKGTPVVKLWFLGNDLREYMIERQLNTSSFRLLDAHSKAPIPSVRRVEDLKEFLRAQYQLDEETSLGDVFESAIGVPQGSFISPFLQQPKPRKAFFDPILKIQVYSKFWENYHEVEKKFDEEIRQIDNEITKIKGELEILPGILQEIESLSNALKTKKIQLQQFEMEYNEADRKYQRLLQIQQSVSQLTTQIEVIDSKISSGRNELASLQSQLNGVTKAIQLCDLNRESYNRFLTLSDPQTELQGRILHIQEQKLAADSKSKDLQNNLSSFFDNAIDASQKVFENLVINESRLSSELEQYSGFTAKAENDLCPFLNEKCKNVPSGSLHTRFNVEVDRLKTDVLKASNDAKRWKATIDTLKGEKKTAISLMQTFAQHDQLKAVLNKSLELLPESEIVSLSTSITPLLETYSEWEALWVETKELPVLSKQAKELGQEITQLKPSYELYQANINETKKEPELKTKIVEKSQAITELQNELSSVREKLHSHQFDPEQLKLAEATRSEKNSQMSSIKTSIDEKKAQLEKNTRQHGELLGRKKVMEQHAAYGRQLSKASEFNTKIRAWIKEAIPEITKIYVSTISSFASAIFAQLFGYSMVKLIWKEDYSVELMTPNNHKTFSQLSGGEQMAAALAIRLAIIKTFSGIDFAFFDEPTTNLDHEKKSNLAASLQNLKGFSQLFVISHDDTFEESANNVVKLHKDQESEETTTEFDI
jgi:exonuclease SbcC